MPALAAAPALLDAHMRVMATDVHVAVVGGDDRALRLAEARLRELEARWSRFLPTSEVSALNRHTGAPVLVSDDTIDLIERSFDAWQRTAGKFDPTVGAAIHALGYDRDFAEVETSIAVQRPPAPAPGMHGVVIDHAIGAVTLPPDVRFDPGGIGKGLAADLTVETLLDAGVRGAMVNVGGDLRAAGVPPSAEGWVVTTPDPTEPATELLRLALPAGAVATSSRLGRRWQTTEGEAHHLVDPRTGRPVASDVVAATVVAGEAWWAEALTKLLVIDGPAALASLEGAHGIVVTADGTSYASPKLERMLR
jgi:thiamine biosynthesis lipoprotein